MPIDNTIIGKAIHHIAIVLIFITKQGALHPDRLPFHLHQHKLLSALLAADGGLFERGLGHADNERTFADGFAAA